MHGRGKRFLRQKYDADIARAYELNAVLLRWGIVPSSEGFCVKKPVRQERFGVL